MLGISYILIPPLKYSVTPKPTNETFMIVHYLSVQETKRVFYRHGYEICRSREALANPEEFELEPLLIVGVFHRDLPLSIFNYCLKNAPISASSMLTEFWSKSVNNPYGSPIVGVPDLLVIDKRLQSVMHLEFFQWLEHIGVPFEFSTGNDSKFTGKIRSLQAYPSIMTLQSMHANEVPKDKLLFPDAEPFPLSLQELNDDVLDELATFRLHNLPPAQRQLAADLYPMNAPKDTFTGSAFTADYDPFSTTLSWHSKNDVKANDIGWEYACSKDIQDEDGLYVQHQSYGSLIINYKDKLYKERFYNTRDEDEYPFESDLHYALDALRIALICTYYRHPENIKLLSAESIFIEKVEDIVSHIVDRNAHLVEHEDIEMLREFTGLKTIDLNDGKNDDLLENLIQSRRRISTIFDIRTINKGEMQTLLDGLEVFDAEHFFEFVPANLTFVDPKTRVFAVWAADLDIMYFCAERNGGSTKAIDEYTYPSEGGAIEVHLDDIQYAVIIKQAKKADIKGITEIVNQVREQLIPGIDVF